MEYKEFEKTLVDLVQNKFGEKYRVAVHQVTKNNGVLLNGMIIMSRDTNISPTIYLEPYFEQYQEGMEMKEILEDICYLYENNQENVVSVFGDLKNFEAIKDKVAYRLIGQDKNERLLERVPFTPFLDLAIVYYLLVDSNESGQMTALIHNEHLKLWEVEREEIHRLAIQNTQRLLPVSIQSMKNIMFNIVAESVENFEDMENICGLLEEDEKEMKNPLFVLSNCYPAN